ncbi:MAG: cation diffusion facilitator family transporter [Pseudomonadota bacterium]
MRPLTPEQRRRERALALGLGLDAALLLPYIGISLWVGSNTLMAEMVRVVLMFAITVFSFITLRHIHRGRLVDFDYGVGKLERLVAALVSVMLVVGACFIVWRSQAAPPPAPPGTALDVVLGIGVAAVNLVVNTTTLLALWRAERGQGSIIVNAQYRARWAKTLGSMVVLLCVIVNLAGSDATLALWADRIGSLFVVCFMLYTAWGMIREAMPDLLDRALEEPLQMEINRWLARHFELYEALLEVRSRRSGNRLFIDIVLGLDPDLPLSEATRRAETMSGDLERLIPGAQVRVLPRAVLCAD